MTYYIMFISINAAISHKKYKMVHLSNWQNIYINIFTNWYGLMPMVYYEERKAIRHTNLNAKWDNVGNNVWWSLYRVRSPYTTLHNMGLPTEDTTLKWNVCSLHDNVGAWESTWCTMHYTATCSTLNHPNYSWDKTGSPFWLNSMQCIYSLDSYSSWGVTSGGPAPMTITLNFVSFHHGLGVLVNNYKHR